MAALREMREGEEEEEEEEEEEGCSKDIPEGSSFTVVARRRTCTADRKNGWLHRTPSPMHREREAEREEGARIHNHKSHEAELRRRLSISLCSSSEDTRTPPAMRSRSVSTLSGRPHIVQSNHLLPSPTLFNTLKGGETFELRLKKLHWVRNIRK